MHKILTAEATHLNSKRSKSTVYVQMNLPLEVARTLRQWAVPVGGRTGIVVAELIAKEAARRKRGSASGRRWHRSRRQKKRTVGWSLTTNDLRPTAILVKARVASSSLRSNHPF